MTTWKEISPFTGSGMDEDAPANAVGGGSVAGLGVGPMGEPGVHPRKKKKKKQTLIDGRTKAYRQHRAKLDANEDLKTWCLKMEDAVIKTVESGIMTKDLAICIHGVKGLKAEHFVTTDEFMDGVKAKFDSM